MFSSTRRLVAVVTVSAGVALIGLGACVASTEEPPPVAQTSHPRGPAQAVIETTLSQGELSAEQRAQVVAIRERLDADREQREGLRTELREAASDIVRSGTADSDQFRQAVDQAATALEERVALSAEAIKELHGLLSPAQRSLVAEGLRARLDERWGKRHRDQHEAFRELTAELMLEPDQVAKLKELRDDLLGQARRLRPTAAELYALVDAFDSERFAAALDAFHAEKAEILREHLSRAGGHANTVLGLLDVHQRDLLAELVEHGRDAYREP